jgi:hypothetical protein
MLLCELLNSKTCGRETAETGILRALSIPDCGREIEEELFEPTPSFATGFTSMVWAANLNEFWVILNPSRPVVPLTSRRTNVEIMSRRLVICAATALVEYD